MRKIFFLTIMYFSAIACLNAQAATPEVIASAGDHYTFPSGSIAWTIGEPVSDTYAGNNFIITKGFHQPIEISLISVPENEQQQSLYVYPNPAFDKIILSFQGMNPGDYTIEMTDAAGKQAYNSLQAINSINIKQEIDLSSFARGIYILKISSQQNNVFRFLKLTKQ
jgi:hypothetical protein